MWMNISALMACLNRTCLDPSDFNFKTTSRFNFKTKGSVNGF